MGYLTHYGFTAFFYEEKKEQTKKMRLPLSPVKGGFGESARIALAAGDGTEESGHATSISWSCS